VRKNWAEKGQFGSHEKKSELGFTLGGGSRENAAILGENFRRRENLQGKKEGCCTGTVGGPGGGTPSQLVLTEKALTDMGPKERRKR